MDLKRLLSGRTLASTMWHQLILLHVRTLRSPIFLVLRNYYWCLLGLIIFVDVTSRIIT